MKKLYTAFKNENVQMVVVITSVFLITGLVALFAVFFT